MVHNSVIIELPSSSFQHRKYVVKRLPLLYKIKVSEPHFCLKPFPVENCGRKSFSPMPDCYWQKARWSDLEPRQTHATERTQTFKCPNRNSPPAEKLSCSYRNKPGCELKKKEKGGDQTISSLWHRVNKVSVGGDHKSSVQSAESETCQQSVGWREQSEITRTAWGMFHIILLCFFFIFIIAMEK